MQWKVITKIEEVWMNRTEGNMSKLQQI